VTWRVLGWEPTTGLLAGFEEGDYLTATATPDTQRSSGPPGPPTLARVKVPGRLW
jgi:hypothetical protein